MTKKIHSAQDLIARSAERWCEYEGLEESTLLRLAILRDLIRLLHAEKSRCLARAMKEEAKTLTLWERQIERVRGMTRLTGQLDDVFQGKIKASKHVRPLPEALFAHIEKEKFERYDRLWEAALAAEAAARSWNFWALEAWVKIAEAADWHKALEALLLPRGIVLFAEMAEPSANAEPSPPDLWHGRWILVLHPNLSEKDFPLHSLPGLSETPAPPAWKPIYPPGGSNTRPPAGPFAGSFDGESH